MDTAINNLHFKNEEAKTALFKIRKRLREGLFLDNVDDINFVTNMFLVALEREFSPDEKRKIAILESKTSSFHS